MVAYKVISADDHMDMVALPPRLWEGRLPSKFRELGPRVVRGGQGNVWISEGNEIDPSGFPKDGTYGSAILRAGIRDDGFRPASAKLRLDDMDRDGVYAQVIYGPPFGIKVKNPDLKAECLRIYNDWALEFNSKDPDRLCVLAYLPMHDPAAAASELRRIAKLGHKGVVASFFESPHPVYDRKWDVLWSAAEETGVPLSIHLGFGCHTLKPVPASWHMAAFAAVAPIQMDEILAALVFSGTLERHPNTKLVLGESGLGWIPYVLERLDFEFFNHGPLMKDITLKDLPSKVFARQVYATFQEDRLGVQLIDRIGVDNVMWASDYPHPDSTFPHSQATIKETLKGLKPSVIKKIVVQNARDLYGVGRKAG